MKRYLVDLRLLVVVNLFILRAIPGPGVQRLL